MSKADPFNRFAVGPDGYIDNPHQTSRLRFRNGEVERAFQGGLSIPVFWTTLVTHRSELTGPVAVIEWRHAVERLESRRSSWQAKTSPHVLRGYGVFVDWVKRFGGGEIQLDLSGLDGWRVTPFLDAVGKMIDFLDARSSEPGPLLCQEDAAVGFRRRKGIYRLEALAADLHWPDEVPLFGAHDTELEAATMGNGPFRAGPWPERRFTEDPLAPLPADMDKDLKERRGLVRRALRASGIEKTKLAVIGNLEGIERMRSTWRDACREFLAAASTIKESAPAFAAKYRVFDDSSLWGKWIDATRQWEVRMEAHLDRHAVEVREAMRQAGFRSGRP